MIRLEMNRKQEAILAAIIIFAALGFFVLYAFDSGQEAAQPEAPAEPAPPTLLETVSGNIAHFDAIDENLYAQLDTGFYSLDNPLVATNPYGTAPLTALVMFNTSEPMRITVHVSGKTEDVSIRHTFDGFETSHFIPVYGLYPGTANLVEIIAEPLSALDESGNAASLSTLLIIETDDIPDNFPESLITGRSSAGKYVFTPPEPGDEEGVIRSTEEIYERNITEYFYEILEYSAVPEQGNDFYFTFMRKSAYDAKGDCRWVYDGYYTQYPTEYTGYGTMLIVAGSFTDGGAVLLEVNMLGRIVGAEPVDITYEPGGYGRHHIERGTLYPQY